MRMQVFEPHVGLGMRGQKLAQAAAHVREADRVDRRHGEPRRDRFVQRADFALQIVVTLHNDARAFVKPLAFGRDHKRPLRAIDELHAHALFQLMDDLAGVRLRHVVGLGGARKAAQVDDVAEDFEESQVHSEFVLSTAADYARRMSRDAAAMS